MKGFIEALSKIVGLELVCANLSKHPSVKKHCIVTQKDGTKVAIVGATTQFFKLGGEYTTEPIAAVIKEIKALEKLKKKGEVDRLVIATHMGCYNPDFGTPDVDNRKSKGDWGLIQAIDQYYGEKSNPWGLIPIFGAHTRKEVNEVVAMSNAKFVLLHAGGYTSKVPLQSTDFVWEKDDKVTIKRTNINPDASEEDLVIHPDIQKIFQTHEKVIGEFDTVVGFLMGVEAPLERTYASQNPFEDSQTALGSLVARALQVYCESELKVLNLKSKNTLGIFHNNPLRGTLSNGKVTHGEIAQVVPFPNEIKIVEITGGENLYRFMSTFSRYHNLQGMNVISDKPKGKDRIGKIKEIIVNEAKIETNSKERFYLALTDYSLAGNDGGPNVSKMKGVKVLDTKNKRTPAEALSDFFTVQEKPVDARGLAVENWKSS